MVVLYVLVGCTSGWILGSLLERGLRSLLAAPVFARENYRGTRVVIGLGLVLVLVALVAGAVVTSAAALGWDFADAGSPQVIGRLSALGPAMVAAALGFGLLGLLDDLGATGDARGFRGHLREMARGALSTGGLKLVGGGLLGLFVVAVSADHELTVFELLRDGAVVALSANVANLFDRRPGRVAKVGLAVLAVAAVVALLGGMVATTAAVWFWLALLAGSILATLPADLGERAMLGDTGSNVIGALSGLGAVLTLGANGRWIVLLVVLALNVVSERVSFSRVFAAVAPLRRFDKWGRRGEN